MKYTYVPNVTSKDEFIERFEKLFTYLDGKNEKSTAEKNLYKVILIVKNNIDKGTPLVGDKENYCNMLPYFELGGGWEMMKSDIGKEATDLLYYFVQNY